MCKASQHFVQYKLVIWLNSQQFSQICDSWNKVSLRAVLSHFHHCGRIAIYNKSHIIGVKAIIRKTDNNWNQKE